MISSVNRNSPLPESEWVTVSTPDLRKTVPARVDTSPDLATRRSIFGHGYNAGDIGVATRRQRPSDQSRKLRHPPADPAELDLDNLADINGSLAISQTLREPSPGSQRQSPPVVVRQQSAKSEIT